MSSKFTKIRGHKRLLSEFEKEIENKSFGGVYLFQGPPSVGKMRIAREVAKYLTCTGLEDDSCRCENCRLFPDHPDYFEVSKGESVIASGDLEEVDGFLSLVPYRSRLRVAVIDSAHNLNQTAASSLLKALESIPEDYVFILVSHRPGDILFTLSSRCYKIEFGHLGPEDMTAILKKQGHALSERKDLERILPYLSGDVLKDAAQYNHHIMNMPRFLKEFPERELNISVAELKYHETQKELFSFVEIFIVYISDIFKSRYGGSGVILNQKHLEQIEELSDIWKEDLCIFLITKLKEAIGRMNQKTNLKFDQFVIPIFLWAHHFLQKSKS